MQPKYPAWLPSPVVDFASSIYPELDISMRLRLQRLTTDSKMEFVWRSLDRETRVPQLNARVHPSRIPEFADAFLGRYIHLAMWADSDADYWKNAPRAQAQNITMRQIHDTARSLINLLSDPLVYRDFTPWDRLDAAVVSARNGQEAIQTLLNKLAENTKGRYWSQAASQPDGETREAEIDAASVFHPLPARALLEVAPFV